MQEIVEIGRATQDELRDDLRELFQGAIRLTLEMVLEEELKAMVGARRFERVGSRKDHRNGTYLRRLLTSLGQIEVAMPRSRDNGSPADVIGRYQRRSPELDEMMVEAYVSGVSQRKMGDVTEALMGERVGRSTVSRVAKRLDEAVEGLRRAPIEGPHPYLYLDATFLDARWARKVENVSALVAYAVGPEGHRRLLAVTLGAEESQQSWSELLEQLQDRGLGGVELVIADEHAGLAAAVRRFLPEARRQRCTVHLQRNVGARVPHRLRKRVAREVSVIFQTSGLAEAKKLLGEFGARWKKELPEAVEVLERGFGAATQFYAFPEAHLGFNLGATKVRQRWDGKVIRHVFESPLVRLMKDYGYRDVYSHGDVIAQDLPLDPRSVIIYRYYDQVSKELDDGVRPDIEVYAQGLSDLIDRIRTQVCKNGGRDPADFRVYLVAHSMGGLICRTFLQNPTIGSEESKAQVDKVFTFATPHNGIDVKVLGNLPGF